MFKKYLTLVLAVLVVNLSMSGVIFAETKAEKESKFVEEVKTSVTKLGTGKDSKIQVKLKDGGKLKGYISRINENSFTVVNEKTGTATEVPYPNAKQVKGNNLSTGAKILIGIGIGVGLAILLSYIGRHVD